MIERDFKISADYELHSIRRIIEATALIEDLRARSRWTRALEFAWNEEVEPEELVWLLGQNGGLSGCARCAAKGLPRYNAEEEDYDGSYDPGDNDDIETCLPRWEKEESDRMRRIDRKYS